MFLKIIKWLFFQKYVFGFRLVYFFKEFEVFLEVSFFVRSDKYIYLNMKFWVVSEEFGRRIKEELVLR